MELAEEFVEQVAVGGGVAVTVFSPLPVGLCPRAGTRSVLLTRLDGLPSDELFAIPATRTASVYVESSMTREN